MVGAGLAGSALAIALGQAGVRTILLDRATFPRDKPCGEGLMPAGVRALEALGLQLDGLPVLEGVTYRVPGAGEAGGTFAEGRRGAGARRLALDDLVAKRAAVTPGVDARFGCEATGLDLDPGGATVQTVAGPLRVRFVVGADGLRSPVARWMRWARPPRAPHRYALVAHLEARRHGMARVTVTLLPGCEVYVAPTGRDELLVALLGAKPGLRSAGEAVRDAYRYRVGLAHPDLVVARDVDVRGAGPFWVRPAAVAKGRAFLVGDAAGFLDPLTGDGMSDALVAARRLAAILSSDARRPDRAYARWEARQWRRRLFVNRLALTLTGSSVLARRALHRLQRRPVTLDRLLEVNDGSRSLWSLTPLDWSALAGV